MKFNEGITIISGPGVNNFRPEGVEFIHHPENNLHPMEQINCMERLIKSYLDNRAPLNIRTNSPEIIQAIHLYMKKYNVFDELHAGLVDQNGNLTDCGNDLDPIFEDLSKTFDFLMELRSEIENGSEKESNEEQQV